MEDQFCGSVPLHIFDRPCHALDVVLGELRIGGDLHLAVLVLDLTRKELPGDDRVFGRLHLLGDGFGPSLAITPDRPSG